MRLEDVGVSISLNYSMRLGGQKRGSFHVQRPHMTMGILMILPQIKWKKLSQDGEITKVVGLVIYRLRCGEV